jgi:exo-beta-1,3-glucanase (GH17 family)
MSTTLGKNIDYYMANVHPWFAGTTVEDSAAWTYEYYMETDVAPAEASPNTPETFVAETGWPTAWTKVVDPSVDQRAGTDATVENLQSESLRSIPSPGYRPPLHR